jgi:hypothetical protein
LSEARNLDYPGDFVLANEVDLHGILAGAIGNSALWDKLVRDTLMDEDHMLEVSSLEELEGQCCPGLDKLRGQD